MNWQENFKGSIKRKEPLFRHTTFKIGGPAEYFVRPEDKEDLKFLITSLKRYKIPFFMIGQGSNLLVSDKGVRGAAIKLDSTFFRTISFRKNRLEAGSGAALGKLIVESASRGFSGLEFLAGIPGTLGGALVMNAGAWGYSIAGVVESVTVMDRRGLTRTLNKKEINFKYRSSGLDTYIVLSAVLRLKDAKRIKIRQAIGNYIKQRRLAQDLSKPNAGCIFKNPGTDSAGKLIDRAGLKNRAVGGAVVSAKHANFILNRKNASYRDVLKLMGLIRKEVKAKYNVMLEPEIKIWK